jgi:hypothetical protein
MAKGQYVRTPLTAAKQKLAWNAMKIDRLTAQLEQAKEDRTHLKCQIETLEKESA